MGFLRCVFFFLFFPFTRRAKHEAGRAVYHYEHEAAAYTPACATPKAIPCSSAPYACPGLCLLLYAAGFSLFSLKRKKQLSLSYKLYYSMFSYFRKSPQHSPVQPAATGDDTVDATDPSNNVASPNNSHNNSTNKEGNPSASSPSNPSQSPRVVHGDTSPSPNPRMSRESEGYPSWLPKRPPPPPPGSTFHSSMGLPDFDQEFGLIRNRELRDVHRDAELTDTAAEGSSSVPFFGGRKPTPRSVRIVSLQDSLGGGGAADGGKRVPSGQSYRHTHPDDFVTPPGHAGVLPEMRVLTRAGGAGISAAAQNAASANPHPRFNARGLHLQLFRSPSKLARIYFYLYPLLVFANVPLQTFFDFNAVFIFVQ